MSRRLRRCGSSGANSPARFKQRSQANTVIGPRNSTNGLIRLPKSSFGATPSATATASATWFFYLTGNLGYYIGARVAESGYVRNRDLGFTETRRPLKSEVLRKFDDTIAMVIAAIEKQTEPRRDSHLHSRA